jgi:hypothetical protein
MRKGLFFLVCVERAAIGDVPKRLFLDLLVAATNQSPDASLGRPGCMSCADM